MYHPSRYTVAHIALFRRECVPIRKNWEVGNLMNGVIVVPPPKNEPVLSYAPGSPEREALRRSLKELRSLHLEIPLVIGGKEIRTGRLGEIRIPHEHGTVLATYHKAGPEELRQAVEASRAAWETWSRTPWHHRASVFLRAAELISGPYRMTLNAATMLGQSKTAHQAEIEAACELSDFLRFGVHNMRQIYSVQPGHQGEGAWNRLDYRPLEGFVFAVSPFNFTAIGGNLSASPALMGNTILWKPASTGVFSSHFVMRIFLEAGLPDGVINFLPGDSRDMELLLTHPDLAGVHFTGSTGAFRRIWKTVAANIETYKNYPRLVGETGGKDFAMVHASADPQVVATALVRGAFEYQGQKCSATSRAYIPKSLWGSIEEELHSQLSRVKVGDIEDFGNFMGAVIDKTSYETLRSSIAYAKNHQDATIVYGGTCDDSRGFFVEPTVILTTDPKFRLMEEELFGPVLTVYLYDDEKYEETLCLCDATSPYGLTGSIFATDRQAILAAEDLLRHAAGNFYINDKTTGAMVGDQPFGGARASGTDDKVGSSYNLLRWTSLRTIKELLLPPRDFTYPFLQSE